MTPRERVLAALNHKAPDRVPLYFGGTSSMMSDLEYFKLKKYLGIQGEIEPYRKGHTGNYYDERILEKFDIDVRFVVFKLQNYGVSAILDDDTIVDDWGIPIKMMGEHASRVNPPLQDAQVDDIEAYPFPSAYQNDSNADLENRAKELYENSPYALVARSPQSSSFLEIGCWLRGHEDFFCDLALDSKEGDVILDRVLEAQLGYYDVFLDKVGRYVHIVETSEDYGTQASMLISPDLFRKKIKTRRKAINELIRKKCPQAKIMHHSCGAIRPIIPDLIEIGIDVLNPVQPGLPGMDAKELKREFGRDVCFCGGFDMIGAMNGTLEEIKQEVQRCVDEFCVDGGYLFSTSNHIQSDTPEINVVKLFEYARDALK